MVPVWSGMSIVHAFPVESCGHGVVGEKPTGPVVAGRYIVWTTFPPDVARISSWVAALELLVAVIITRSLNVPAAAVVSVVSVPLESATYAVVMRSRTWIDLNTWRPSLSAIGRTSAPSALAVGFVVVASYTQKESAAPVIKTESIAPES